jgi:hypothetical protein
MRSMQQLGVLGTITAFAFGQKETKKNCAEEAGRRTFRILEERARKKEHAH